MSKKKPSTPLSAGSSQLPIGRIRKNTPPQSFTEDRSDHDERYSYLIRFGKLKKSLANGNVIFAELGQIPGVWICYRRPAERESNPDKMQLDSLELDHIPLLEGEEKLKVLSFQHNLIKRIENMVSLPNLLYLDLLDNKIETLTNLESLVNLRILLMAQNLLAEIKGLEGMSKLEVLDLHSNRIKRLDGLSRLRSLKILNLADNLMEGIEGVDGLESLEELNLKMNRICSMRGIEGLRRLQKLFLCENKIKEWGQVQGLERLEELALDGNELSTWSREYIEKVFSLFPALKVLDHKEKKEVLQEIAQARPEKKLSRNKVLEVIRDQWEKEVEKLRIMGKEGGLGKGEKELFSLDSGHAEIDCGNSLLIYGNAYKVVLLDVKHQAKIKKILFKYVLFEHLTQGSTFEALLRFSQLEELTFSDNNITSLLQISKLEPFLRLKTLEIFNNPISQTTLLPDFIIYRFPKIQRVNDIVIEDTESDQNRKKARLLFENFDKILQLPEKAPKPEFWAQRLLEARKKPPSSSNKSGSVKQVNKLVSEASEKFMSGVLIEMHEEKRVETEFERCWSGFLSNLLKSLEN